MKKFLFFLALFLYTHHAVGQKWIQTSISNRVKVELPTQPEIQDTLNIKFFNIIKTDYIINIALTDMTQNAKFNVTPDNISDFYKSFIKGALHAATNSKVLDENKIEISGLEGREITYTKDFNGITGIHIIKRVLLIDRTVFTFEVWDLSGKGQEKLITRLFKSITVTH